MEFVSIRNSSELLASSIVVRQPYILRYHGNADSSDINNKKMSDLFKPTELNKLKYHQLSLENAVNSILLRLRNCPDFVEVLEEFETSKTRSEAQREQLLDSLAKIRAGIDAKRRLILDKEALDSINDFKAFKKEMIIIQDQIQSLKMHVLNELMRLSDEIVDVDEDVDFYSNRMVEWSQNHRINVLPSVEVPNTVRKIANRHQCKEMRDFMDFVHRSNGHENGWRQEDHLLFLKIRKKHKDSSLLSSKLHELLPDISVDDIKRHEEWYKQYLRLNKLKKAAVKTWQQSKKPKPHKPGNQVDTHEDLPKIIMEDLHDRLNKWKEEKEAKLMQNKQMQILKEMQQKGREEQRKKLNEEKKKIVMEWKQTKEEMKEQQMLEEKEMEKKEKRRRASEANRMIKSFQTQDDTFVTKILQQRKKKEVKLPVRSKSSQLASRDPERLLRPTEQWINRVHDDKTYGILDGNPGKLPKLKVPEWRQQIS